ncbi:DUF4352 domain-containing protein [Clostridium sp.]|uniref:DUF4352 domain-containing protein n=1 Tax=Clostridium sp. TaxID=1506 RepID=UPI001A5341D5|nr:DUF4352 domain-containing protein [Clostridium sp.]MBK5243358.1 DUF4352 domain-containing protein [Clostridium sp.]
MSKKHIIISIILVTISFIIGFFIGDTTAINAVNKKISQRVETTNVAETVAPVKTEPKEENKVATKIGSEATSGSWNIKILEAKEATVVKGGDSSDNKTTKEKFIVLKLQMKNITTAPVQYAPTEFMLGDIKSKSQYNTAFEAMQTANSNEIIYKENSEFIGVYDDANPNMPKQTYIIFEVPKTFNIADGVLINANSGAEAVGYSIK